MYSKEFKKKVLEDYDALMTKRDRNELVLLSFGWCSGIRGLTRKYGISTSTLYRWVENRNDTSGSNQ
jgi:transposase-like protein